MSVPFYHPMDLTQDLGQIPPGFDNSTAPINTYQETEPVPVTTYQESASVAVPNHQDSETAPVETHQGKDDFWENGFKHDESTPKTKDHNEEFKSTPVNADLNGLPPVPPGTTGEGLPYAPVDWPNPGDVWTWRVGRRVGSNGFYQDRFITVPQRLQKRNAPKSFGSQQALSRFIEKNIPGADINAFFSSFSWKIPSSQPPPEIKVNTDALFEEEPTTKEGMKEEAASADKPLEDGRQGTHRYSQRQRKPAPPQFVAQPAPEKPKTAGRQGSKKRKEKAAPTATGSAATATATPGSTTGSSKQKMRQSSRRVTKHAYGEVDLNDEKTPVEKTSKKRRGAANVEEEQVSIPHIYVSPVNGVIAVSHSPVDINPEEFDSYLNSLDNLLAQPQENQVSADVAPPLNEAGPDYDLSEARMKLINLLEQGFPALFHSKEVSEVAMLASKLRKDPNLSAEEIVKLKLAEEVPSFSEVFLENKGVIEEADKFFSALELNKAKVASLKYEYSDLKEKLSQINLEVDSNTKAIREIDDQISQLQARRAELTRLIGNKKKETVDLNYAQKMVANSIPNVVQEVQTSNARKPDWEMKKENALKREDEILAKFAPLKGFYLHPNFTNLF